MRRDPKEDVPVSDEDQYDKDGVRKRSSQNVPSEKIISGAAGIL